MATLVDMSDNISGCYNEKETSWQPVGFCSHDYVVSQAMFGPALVHLLPQEHARLLWLTSCGNTVIFSNCLV